MDDDCLKGQSIFVVLDRPSQIAVFNLIIFNPFIKNKYIFTANAKYTILVNDEINGYGISVAQLLRSS